MSNQELFSQNGSGLVAAPVASTLNAAFGSKMGLEDQHVNSGCPLFVAHTLLGEENDSHAADMDTYIAFNSREDPEVTFDRAGCLSSSSPQSQAIAFSSKDHGADASDEVSPTIRAGGHNESHANAGTPPAIAFMAGQGAKAGSVAASSEVSPTLRSGSSGTNQTPSLASDLAVRRLTPIECERLQGFPDNHTQIPWRKKDAANCPDGPRYKSIGNSMAVNCMRWIGRRIELVERLAEEDLKIAA